MTGLGADDDDLVPVSVRLGQVVPPEDPEDWTRPLTWVAAIGMLLGPVVALAWFAAAPPTEAVRALPATHLVAVALAAGATATGATQIGVARAWTATLAAGLFGALGIVILGVVTAGERQVGAASPTLAHGVAAAVAGLGGAVLASLAAALVARIGSRLIRFVAVVLPASAVAVAMVGVLLAS